MAEVQSYVVHNTFVEVVESADSTMESKTIPAFRRRRGSSFFRCSSEPLTSARHRVCHPEDSATSDDCCEIMSTVSTSSPPDSTDSDCASEDNFKVASWADENDFGDTDTSGFHPGQTMLAATAPSPLCCNTPSTVESRSSCHLIWCDHRAFKDSSSQLKQQLEACSRATVKTHKTADNCIRLFRKKQRAQGRPPCVILVSWTNAPALLQYLGEAGSHVNAKVVVLCDARSCRKGDSGSDFSASYPNLCSVATSWEEALSSVCSAIADLE